MLTKFWLTQGKKKPTAAEPLQQTPTNEAGGLKIQTDLNANTTSDPESEPQSSLTAYEPLDEKKPQFKVRDEQAFNRLFINKVSPTTPRPPYKPSTGSF